MWSLLRVSLLAFVILFPTCIGISKTRERKFRHGKTTVNSVRNLPNGKQFISASYDGTVIMWDVHSGKRIWQADLDAKSKAENSHTISHILGMDLSANGLVVAISYSQSHVVGETLKGQSDYRIALLDSATGQVLRLLTGHTALIGGLAFSPTSELLLSESGDGTARLWNINTGKEVLVIKLKERGASVAFSPDGKLLAVATQPVYGLPPQPIVGLYEARTGDLVREFPRRKNVVTGLAFSPDSQALVIAVGDAEGAEIDLWGLTGQKPKLTLPAPRREIRSIAFSRDGRILASGGHGNGYGLVEIREMVAAGPVQTFKFESDVTAFDFSPDGNQLVVGTDKGQIILLRIKSRSSPRPEV
jgi:WD40 repeat protein